MSSLLRLGKSGRFNARMLLLAAAGLVGLVAWGSEPALADQFIVNVLSQKCLDVSGARGTASGTQVQIWDCERGNAATDQLWEFTAEGQIRNVLSGRCLDVSGASGTANGSKVQIWDCESSARVPNTDQLWMRRGDGSIQNRASGRCLDVSGAPGRANGAKAQLWDCEDPKRVPGTDQLWRAETVAARSAPTEVDKAVYSAVNLDTETKFVKVDGEEFHIKPVSMVHENSGVWTVSGQLSHALDYRTDDQFYYVMVIDQNANLISMNVRINKGGFTSMFLAAGGAKLISKAIPFVSDGDVNSIVRKMGDYLGKKLDGTWEGAATKITLRVAGAVQAKLLGVVWP